MNLTLINGSGPDDADVMVHRAGCRDISKYTRSFPRHDMFTEEHDSKRSAWLEYNADFLGEEGGAYELTFYPCTAGLEDGGEYNL